MDTLRLSLILDLFVLFGRACGLRAPLGLRGVNAKRLQHVHLPHALGVPDYFAEVGKVGADTWIPAGPSCRPHMVLRFRQTVETHCLGLMSGPLILDLFVNNCRVYEIGYDRV